LCEYFSSDAQAWEAASFLKARPIAGNFALASTAIQSVFSGYLQRGRSQPDPLTALRKELLEMRRRLEEESTDPVFPWTHATPAIHHPAELKKDPGGFFDIEYIFAFLQLQMLLQGNHDLDTIPLAGPFLNPEHPPSARERNDRNAVYAPVPFDMLQAVARTRVFTPDDSAALASSYTLFRSIDHAARLITGRATHRLPDPSLASRISRLLNQWDITHLKLATAFVPAPEVQPPEPPASSSRPAGPAPVLTDLSASVSSALTSTRALFSRIFKIS
jgi:glutamate-ammonia-ligase adenylyltransferase